MTESRTIHVDTLHMQGTGQARAVDLRQAAAAWLGAADLHPPGLSPSAVLIVRALPDPMPRGCGALVPGSRPSVRWIEAVRRALDDVAHRAACPKAGRLPPHTEAVCFADRAEWMACLALDLAQGTAGSRWWWRHFLRATTALEPSPRLVTALSDPPRAVPAVLAHLAAWRCAGDVLQALPSDAAALVLDRAAAAYGVQLPAIDSQPPVPHSSGRSSSPLSAGKTRERSPDPPWDAATQALIPADAPSRLHAALLGVGLTLHRRASDAHRPSFAAALAQWDKAPAARPSLRAADAPPPKRPVRRVAPTPAGETGASAREDEREEARLAPASAAGQASGRSRDAGPPSDEATHALSAGPPSEYGAAPVDPHAPAPPASQRAPDRPSGARRGAAERQRTDRDATSPPPPGPSAAGKASPEPETSPLSGSDGAPAGSSDETDASGRSMSDPLDAFSFRVEPEVISTELGGVLYLINLMVRLELPDLFEDDHCLASTAGPWGTLEAVARGLLGPQAEHFSDDGMWTALAHLDDRDPETPPGASFPPPEAFSCPSAWIEESGGLEGPLCWHASGGRMRVWNDTYLLADHPQHDADPAAGVGHVAQWYSLSPAGIRFSDVPDPWWGRSGPSEVAPTLAAWTARAIPFLRYRLTSALGCPLDTDLVSTLFAVPGVLHLSSMHVDWTAPLDAVSLSVRLAGLDRDPGWEPSFARVILFHFD